MPEIALPHKFDRFPYQLPPYRAREDPKTQGRSRSSNRRLTFRGKTMTLVEWAATRRIKPVTLAARLNRKWGI